jgi:hypothetical protein
MTWNASTPSDTETSRGWDDALRELKTDLAWHFQYLCDGYPARVTASRLGFWRVGYRGVKADLPATAAVGALYYVAETDHLYFKAASGAWLAAYPPAGGDPRDALTLPPNRLFLSDAFMYAPGDVILDDLPRPDYAAWPGYRALAVGRFWVGDVLYTARACFTFDLTTAPTAGIQQVFFDFTLMEYGTGTGGAYLDILPGGPGPTPLAFHHATDPATSVVGDDRFRVVNPPFTGIVPASMGWDITGHYLWAIQNRSGLILRMRAKDETTLPPRGAAWSYGIASADVPGYEPRLTVVFAASVPPPGVPGPVPPGPTPPPTYLRLAPGRGFQADAYMYAPGDVIVDDVVRPDAVFLPGYRALAVGRIWVGSTLYTSRACFTFDLTGAPSSVRQVFFDIDLMEYVGIPGAWLDGVPGGGPGPVPLAFHHAVDPAGFILGDERFRWVSPFTGAVPAVGGWDITEHYRYALPLGGLILRLRIKDESIVPSPGGLSYGIASADVAGREPRLTIFT